MTSPVRLHTPLGTRLAAAALEAVRRAAAALAHAWHAQALDPRSSYLSQATDLADLERRLRLWDERQCRHADSPRVF